MVQTSPPTMSVDQFQALFERCSNWGRWGPDDERGTLNLITPEVTRRAAALIREGVTVSCAWPLNTVADAENTQPAVHLMLRAGDVVEEVPTRSTADYLAWPRTARPTPTWTRSATWPGGARSTMAARSAWSPRWAR